MKIIVGESPLDVQIFDNSGQKVDLNICGVGFKLKGGRIPVATLELEIMRAGEFVIEGFDINLLAKTYYLTEKKEKDSDADIHTDA